MAVIFALCLAWYIFCVMPERAGICALWNCCVRTAGKSDSAVGFDICKLGNGGGAAGTPPSEKIALSLLCPIAWVRDKSASLARAVGRVRVWLEICRAIPEKWGSGAVKTAELSQNPLQIRQRCRICGNRGKWSGRGALLGQFNSNLNPKRAPQRAGPSAVVCGSFGSVGCRFEVERKAAYQIKLPAVHGGEPAKQLRALGECRDQRGLCNRYTLDGGFIV